MIRAAVSVILSSAAAAGVVVAAVHGLARGWRFSGIFEFALFWGGVVAAAAAVSVWLARNHGSRLSVAEDLGRGTGRGGLFSAALEFAAGGERLAPYSGFLMRRTIADAASELEKLEPSRMFSHLAKPGWTIAGILAGAVLLLQASLPGADLAGMLRAISDPSSGFGKRERFNLAIGMREMMVNAGEDAVVEAARLGSRKGEVRIRYSTVPGVWNSERADQLTGGAPAGDLSVYRHTFRDVQEDITYLFTAGGEESGEGIVRVIHRPVVNRVTARLVYPAYTGAAPDTVETLAGRLAALKGTRVELFGETSKPVSGGAILFSSGGRMRLEPGGRGFSGEFVVTRDDTIRMQVVDSLGLESDMTLAYPVAALEDAPPMIEIISPEEGSHLPRSMETPLVYRASDDFGLSSIDLLHMKEGRDAGYVRTPLPAGAAPGSRSAENSWTWSLSGSRVFPGDRILYYAEAADNKSSGGPNRARTPVRVLIVPSLSDIYAEARREEDAVDGKAEEIVEESREIRDRLKDLADDFRADGGMDWEKRSEGERIVEIQKELQEKIREAAEGIDRALDRLEENRMTSMEVGRKMEEIQRLLREIESEDLKESIERLRSMMSRLSEQEMARAMDQVEMDAEMMAERLDRTIELLKQILMEERLEELVRRMEEILADQTALRDSTVSGDLEALSPRQEDLAEEFEGFEQDMKEFSGGEPAPPPEAGFEEMIEKLAEAKIDSLMRQASMEMRSEMRGEAGATQQQTVEKMISLYTRLGRCQMVMSAQADQETIRMVEDAVREIIEVSQLQEEVLPVLERPDAGGGIDAILERSHVVREAIGRIVERLIEAGRREMAISNDVFVHLGAAAHRLNMEIEAVSSRSYSPARSSAEAVSKELNLAAIELLRSSSASGGSGGEMQQQMQTMMQQQSSIDERMKRMLEEAESGEMSMRARAEMARLAAEQRSLGEMMRSIEEQSRGTGELLGRIGDLADQMRQVASELEEGRLDEGLVRREERILSRMLESQRSLNRRDYSRERISRTAGDLKASGAAGTPEGVDDIEVLLERIRNAMREKGPAEYEELIRAYFRALSVKVRNGAAD